MDRIKIGFNFSFDINAPKSTETEYQELQNILGRLTENKSPFLKKKQPTKYKKKKKMGTKKENNVEKDILVPTVLHRSPTKVFAMDKNSE